MEVKLIQIVFPRLVEITVKQQQMISRIIDRICDDNKKKGLTMWPSDYSFVGYEYRVLCFERDETKVF